MAYFLISLANRENLDLCIDFAMAGFTNSINGAWTFVEINEGDYISFLYGAKAHNLYLVEKKTAFKNANELPPWPPVTFQTSGRTYYFPFRLFLKPVREFKEPLIRTEFAYIANNLLQRGGYRKTHFQADQTTLQSVSQMGTLFDGAYRTFDSAPYESFNLSFTKNKTLVRNPEVLKFQEFILQSAIRQHLNKSENLQRLLSPLNVKLPPESLEILGEKALSEGHVDLLIKESVPLGKSKQILVEIKTGSSSKKDVDQLKEYVDEVGDECAGGILIASKFSKKIKEYAQENRISLVAYNIPLDFDTLVTFEQISERLQLAPAIT